MGVVEEVKADLEALLVAGRIEFPEKAAEVSEVAGLLATETEGLNLESSRAGDPRALRDVLRICGDVHEGLRLLVESLNYCSRGLIEVAEGYAQTDVDGAAAFEQIDDALTEGPPPAEAPLPPDLGDPETRGTEERPSTPQPEDPEDLLDEHDDELESPAVVEFPVEPS